MTTKILTGTYSSGYTLAAPITLLSIASTGVVEGTGVFADPAARSYAVINDDRIVGSFGGVYLSDGGTVTNQSRGTISTTGDAGAVTVRNATGSVTNASQIHGGSPDGYGVWLRDGGSVVNDKTGVITGGGLCGIS